MTDDDRDLWQQETRPDAARTALAEARRVLAEAAERAKQRQAGRS